MQFNKNEKYSSAAIAIVFAVLLSVFSYYGLWKKNRVTLDAPSYYTYMPAFLLQKDLSLDYIDKNPEFYKGKVWFYRIGNNKKLIKHPAGISVALSPFFLAGHIIAKLTGASTEGYSMPYQNAVSIGVLAWLLLGLYYLKRILRSYFSDLISAITILLIVLATNLLWYSSFEGFMPHAVSFSLWCAGTWHFMNWMKAGEKKHLFIFAVGFGLCILIRPLALTAIIWFLIYAVIYKGCLRAFFDFLKLRMKEILIAALISFLIAFIQLAYWKYATGKWFFDVYVDEHFVFNSPKMLPFLFSFRKGLLIYSPVFFFAIIGFFVLLKKQKEIFWSSLVLLFLTVFLLSSWWAWSYGISWGLRPMIDYYSFLAVPLAAGISFLFRKGNLIKWITSVFLLLFTLLNLFQTWQYKNGLIHYDDMSKESYFMGFFQTRITPGWLDHLKPYSWQRRINGLPQIHYSEKFIEQIPASTAVYFRGSNLLYVSCSIQADFLLTCYYNDIGKEEQFFIERCGETVSIKASNGKYLSWKPAEYDFVAADATFAGDNEKFMMRVLEDNKITLQAANGKMLSIGSKPPFIIRAAGLAGSEEYFRLFIIDDHQTR